MRSKLNFLIVVSLKRKIKSKCFLFANLIIGLVIVCGLNIDSIITFFGGDFNDKTTIYVVDKTNISFETFKNQMEANNMRKSLIPSVKMLQRYITNVSDCSSYQDNQLLEEIHSPCGLFSLNAMLRAAMFLKETLYDIPMKQQYSFPLEID